MKTNLEVGITPHAIERYQVRLGKEHLVAKQVREEIRALMDYAQVTSIPPEWLNENGRVYHDRRSHFYLIVEDIVFPAKKLSQGGFLLLSCITRGSISPHKRARKNSSNQIKRTKKGAGLRRWNGK